MTDPVRLQVPTVTVPVEDPTVVRRRAQGRVRMVGGVLAMMLAATTARGVSLSVSPDERTLAIAAENRWAAVSTQGPRGEILDTDGHVLAMSVRSPAVFADPGAIRERGLSVSAIARGLADVLELDEGELVRKLSGQGRYVRLSPGITPEAALELANRGLTRAKGIIVEENYKRYYPQGTMAAHLIGFIDEEGGGVTGLERSFDERLSGSSIISQQRVNRFGAVVDPSAEAERTIQGMQLQTTIDRVIQRATERALASTMETFDPVSATAVVVEVSTGRIRAMASAPTFNPNRLRDGDILHTRNLAVTDAIEPGSVIKPITYAAALEAGVTHPAERIATPSPYNFAGKRIKDDHPRASHSMTEMIKHSSNIASGLLAHRVGQSGIDSAFEAFGLGERSGVRTFGETRGQRHPARFGPVELATVSYGQGMTATPMQLALAVGAIANGGERMRPLLVERIVDPSTGRTLDAREPSVARRVVSEETAAAVARAMETVLEPGGTAYNARVSGYTSAGKTGTALKVKDGRYSATARYATFVGFAPADAPLLAMAVIVDEPRRNSRYGGSVAGPVFSSVMAESLRHLGVPVDPALLTDIEDEEQAEDEEIPVYTPVTVAWHGEDWRMPDLVGRPVRDALTGLQGLGVELELSGSGVVASQTPRAGEALRPGDTVSLRFQ